MKQKKPVTPPRRRQVSYLLPSYLVDPHLKEIEEAIGQRLRRAIIVVNEELEVEAYRPPAQIKGRPTLERIFPFIPELKDATTPPKMVKAVMRNGREIPFITGEGRAVNILRGTALPNEELKRTMEIGDIYSPLLEEITRLTGWSIRFHLGDPPVTPPYPIKEGVIDLITGASPPGEIGSHLLTHACGVRIHAKMEKVACRTPVSGRGIALHDEAGMPVVQLIDNTAYLLVPVVSYFYGEQSVELFRKLLAITWNGLLARAKNRLKVPARSRGKVAFIEGLSKQVNLMAERIEEHDRETEEEIRLLLDALQRKLAEQSDRRDVLEGLRNGKCREVIEALPDSYRRLKRHPLITDVYLCEGGLQTDTELILIRHEATGQQHRIGRFTIRLGVDGVVSIWSIRTDHPEGVPHPHISKQGTPCYGNGTQAILSAGAEKRYADCIELVLRWLSEGYLAESALHKLEEWPVDWLEAVKGAAK